MKKQRLIILFSLFFALFGVFLTKIPTQAANLPILEVSEVRSLGNEVKVPITLYNTSYLNSLSLTIRLPEEQNGVRFKSFEPMGIFASDQFSSYYNNKEKALTVDFLSMVSTDITLRNQKTVIGVVTYSLSSEFKEGETVHLKLEQVRAKGRANADVVFDLLDGKIDRRLPVGGVVDGFGPSVAGAMRILQHVDGSNLITEREMFLSADVDGNGKLTQDDAQQILDYVTGVRSSFLAIETVELPDASAFSNYSQTITSKHGREPYTYKNVGSLPSGLTLNKDTGEITGTSKVPKNYPFTIQVTDAVGNIAQRTFVVNIVDSNIIEVEKLPTINVKRGEEPELPSQILVTYKDKTKGREPITWEDVDTSQIGETTVHGVVGESGFKVSIKINVVNTNYINNIDVDFFQILNFHTITVDVDSEVYSLTINDMKTHYESNNTFSLASSSLTTGSIITIKAFDKFGNLLETKTHKLEIQ